MAEDVGIMIVKSTQRMHRVISQLREKKEEDWLRF